MKRKLTSTLIFSAVLAITTAMFFSNCEKAKTSNCDNKGLTCTVDGSSFQSCAITLIPFPQHIWLQAQPENVKSSIHLYMPKSTGTFVFGKPPYSAQYWDQSNPLKITSYTTDSTYLGSVTITKYDSTNKMMSGTFNFNSKQLYPVGNGQKNVTAGTFTDIKWQ